MSDYNFQILTNGKRAVKWYAIQSLAEAFGTRHPFKLFGGKTTKAVVFIDRAKNIVI